MSTMSHVKNALALALAAICRCYFLNSPSPIGKRLLWDRLVLPYIAWRPLHIQGKTKFGAKINVEFPDIIQTFIYFFGVWEPAITTYIRQILRPGDIFIDVGANVGYHTF